MRPTVVLNVVGLTRALLGRDTPHLNALAADGVCVPMRAVTPAVTCSAQASILTGTLPRDHGVVGNGWYFRDLAQVMFWRQSNQLVARLSRSASVTLGHQLHYCGSLGRFARMKASTRYWPASQKA